MPADPMPIEEEDVEDIDDMESDASADARLMSLTFDIERLKQNVADIVGSEKKKPLQKSMEVAALLTSAIKEYERHVNLAKLAARKHLVPDEGDRESVGIARLFHASRAGKLDKSAWEKAIADKPIMQRLVTRFKDAKAALDKAQEPFKGRSKWIEISLADPK